MNMGGVNGPGFNATNISLPWYCWGHTFLFLFIYLFFFFLLFWLLLLTGGVNITKVFSEIYYPPIPNKMVALSTGREVTNQVENNKGVSLIFFFLVGLESMQFHKGGICLHRKGDKKKNMLCS